MLDVDEHHWWYRGRRRIIRAELDRLPIPQGARILDAGCGSGRTLQELIDYGSVSGLELNPDAAQVARDRQLGDVEIGRLEELPWEADSFDLITCLDVLEHLENDRDALAELRRVSRPGGWMLATVPAYQALWSSHDTANHHFRRYERATLRAAVSESGWQLQRLTSFNTLLFPPAAAVRLAQRRFKRNGETEHFDLQLSPDWLNNVLERPLKLEANWLSKGRSLPAGLSLLAILHNPPA
jgi:SAM-dependent methyltransferase